MPCRIILCLRVATHIGIGIHPLHVPLLRICRQEHAYLWVIVARVIVVQPRQTIVVLPGEALGRVDAAFEVAGGAIWPEYLVPFDRSATGYIAEAGKHIVLLFLFARYQ